MIIQQSETSVSGCFALNFKICKEVLNFFSMLAIASVFVLYCDKLIIKLEANVSERFFGIG